MRKLVLFCACLALLLGAVGTAWAEVIDPEAYILKNGYHSYKLGDDGKTQFYTFTERAAPDRLRVLSGAIEALPKHEKVHKVCDFMRGGAKADC